MNQLLTQRRELIEEALTELVNEHKKRGVVGEAMHYAVQSGGKRLRPLLALGVAEVGAELDEAVRLAMPAALSIELLHTYTLVHDDLPALDDDDMRRGVLTVHRKFGEAMAVLAGDGLHTSAFQQLGKLENNVGGAVECLAKYAGIENLIHGQEMDLSGRFSTAEDVIEMHEKKTASLFVAACKLGGLAMGNSADFLARWSKFGWAFGLAFQALDDLDDGDSPLQREQLVAAARSHLHTCEEFASEGAVVGELVNWLRSVAKAV